MRAVIVYESMYGNPSRCGGDRARTGPGRGHPRSGRSGRRGGSDPSRLVLVGGPTHVHGLSRPSTRRDAIDAAGSGVRECLGSLPELATPQSRRVPKSTGVAYRAERMSSLIS